MIHATDGGSIVIERWLHLQTPESPNLNKSLLTLEFIKFIYVTLNVDTVYRHRNRLSPFIKIHNFIRKILLHLNCKSPLP